MEYDRRGIRHPAPPNYPLRYPIYQLIETIRPLIEVHWGAPGWSVTLTTPTSANCSFKDSDKLEILCRGSLRCVLHGVHIGNSSFHVDPDPLKCRSQGTDMLVRPCLDLLRAAYMPTKSFKCFVHPLGTLPTRMPNKPSQASTKRLYSSSFLVLAQFLLGIIIYCPKGTTLEPLGRILNENP